jgi:hypothetical protein
LGHALLIIGGLLVASDARAVYHPHPICDPEIGDFDNALTGDPGFGNLKARIDAQWTRLASHGDPDVRAASRNRRLNWLCEIKKQCGADIKAARACVQDALRRREQLNEDLLRQLGDVQAPSKPSGGDP